MCPVSVDMGSLFANEVGGLDIGGAFAKAVIFYDQSILGSAVLPVGGNPGNAARRALDQALAKADTSLENIKCIVATGKSAAHFKNPKQFVETHLCIGRGLSYLSRSIRTVVDFGERAIRGFRFIPRGMEWKFSIEDYTEQPLPPAARGGDIAAAVSGILALIGFEPVCALVGGGAKDPDMIHALQRLIADTCFIPDEPRTVAALGAALIAEDTLLFRQWGNPMR
jgi:activator of 2-hydroxyglutaryl-CoA dehydratase